MARLSQERSSVALTQPFHSLGTDLAPRLAEQLIGEQSSAHAYLAMDAPDGKFDPFGVERLLPGKDMLIYAVDKRTVEVEQEDRIDTHHISPALLSVPRIGLRQFD
jgi:hypothetical protein